MFAKKKAVLAPAVPAVPAVPKPAKPFNPDAYKNGQVRLLAYMKANLGNWLTVEQMSRNSWLQEPTRAIRYLRDEGWQISMRPTHHHRYEYRLTSPLRTPLDTSTFASSAV